MMAISKPKQKESVDFLQLVIKEFKKKNNKLRCVTDEDKEIIIPLAGYTSITREGKDEKQNKEQE
jgi:hypothetical protein